MIDAFLRKLRARDDLLPGEEDVLRRAVGETRRVPAHRTIIRAWEPVRQSTLLLSGWTARAKDLESGERQITEINLVGDFIDLHSFTLKELDHDVVALTDCELACVPHEAIREITEKFPHLARLMWLVTNLDAAIHREWMLSMGRRSALARVAHLFCELLVRLQVAGCAGEDDYAFPLTQIQVADCLGLTSVHVNRTLQELRKRGLVELRNRHVRLPDLGELQRLAQFDPGYLYPRKQAR
ncbi:Crp/Fnr family transcriptional regulator [Sphingomonas sp.]|uniref:Crp/Fnr family transcriptional regulator n=1 Tax=Sphingomonas sp. TaxID=28214 RepID=UPI0025E8118F|nr:Crp/Fnr family transcriptional regulator [Sphingomonas sp.]MBV9527981.1 Crp/Fnr family transcriptional regulator [Sphingomonas sp.]